MDHNIWGFFVPLYHILVLALVQGVTEFLPISSSGHLVITSHILGWADQGLLMDVAVHVGTLFAVMIYFWRDLWMIVSGVIGWVTRRRSPGTRLAGQLLVATLPVVVVGYFGRDYIGQFLRDPELIAWTTIGFAVVLWCADKFGMTLRRMEHIGFGSAAFIGLAQVLALVPGTSRSGITMTAGRILGMERRETARFSLLMSIPVIIGAGLLGGIEIYEAGDIALGRDVLVAAGLACAAGLVSIAAMMHWLRRARFTPFVIYRLLLGMGLLYWLYADRLVL